MTRFVNPSDFLYCRRLLARCLLTCRNLHIPPTPQLLVVSVGRQRMWLLIKCRSSTPLGLLYIPARSFLISTSRFGVGQRANTNLTPLGLHRIVEKIGAAWPIGTVFANRRPIGFSWNGHPSGAIVHRILRLEGLQPGFNAGDDCDSFKRAIYIHGVADESKLGRPNSHGCIHMSSTDLILLFDRANPGTMVWIDKV